MQVRAGRRGTVICELAQVNRVARAPLILASGLCAHFSQKLDWDGCPASQFIRVNGVTWAQYFAGRVGHGGDRYDADRVIRKGFKRRQMLLWQKLWSWRQIMLWQ